MKFHNKLIILFSLVFIFILISNLRGLDNEKSNLDNKSLKENLDNRFNDDMPKLCEDIHIFNWSLTWGGVKNDYCNAVAIDSLNNIYVAGTTRPTDGSEYLDEDICLIKFNSSGFQEWNLTWGGNTEDFGTAIGDEISDDICQDIVIDSLNNIYILGYIIPYFNPNPYYHDICLIKYNSSGVQQWNRTWGGNVCYGMVLDSFDNIYITGNYFSNFPNLDICLLKYDSSGVQQWNKTWGGNDDDIGYAIALDSSNNIYITGTTYSYGGGTENNLLLVKFDNMGNFQWYETWGQSISSRENGYAIFIDTYDNIFITGSENLNNGVDYNLILLKYNNQGSRLWIREWGGTDGDDNGFDVAVDWLGNIYIAGETSDYGAGSVDMCVIQYDSSGTFQWYKTWGGINDDIARSIVFDSKGNYFIGGKTSSFGSGGSDICLVKYYNTHDNAPFLSQGMISPSVSNQSTLYNFSVIYTDIDNDAPEFINVIINGTTFSMEKVSIYDSNYTDGCVFYYQTYLSPAKYNYTYNFECSDKLFFNSTIVYSNLEVNETNEYLPYLSNSQVSPIVGNNLILYNFTVWYFDDDNNLPKYINITINQTTYSMQPCNPLDNNVMDGTQYYFNKTLYFGYYKFQINCSDGLYVNSTSWIDYPKVDPFYDIGGVSLSNPANESFVFTGNINFTWISLEAFFGSVNYTLQISNITDFSEILYEETDIKEMPAISNLSHYISYQSGLYYWRVQPMYGIFKGNWSNYFIFNLTYNEKPPVLTSPTIKPNIGDQFSKFNFTVLYSDPDNNYPYLMNVVINGTSYSMSKVNPSDTNYIDGCVFQYLTYLSPDLYNYTYYFECYDGKYSTFTLSYNDLEVYESNNHVPYLLNQQVSPIIGINSTLFNFTVWYYDDDNNLPNIVNITINNTTYLMVQVDPLDNNAMDGILYYYNTTLDFGYYQFQINCSDFRFSNSTDWIFAPEVNPFYGCEPITLLNPVNDSLWFTSILNFTWTSLELLNGAIINYTLQISNDTDFTYIVFEKEKIEELSEVTNLLQYIDFSSGLYYWRVCATYEVFASDWSDYLMFNLIYNENNPSLMFCSVIPQVGDQYTELNFTVVYFDPDNNYPYSINVTINSTSYSMLKVDPFDTNYTDGCIYQYRTYLSPDPYNYTYSFECYDGKYSNFTIIFNNLKVKETSIFKPRLLNPYLYPIIGNNSILYNFTVWYFDDDNNFPLYVNITINDTIYTMVQVNPFDTNAIDGIEFYYYTSLDFGYYQFQINCSDGFQTNATDWILGPEVNPFYKYGCITLLGPENFTNFFTGFINFTWISLEAPFGDVNYTIQISNYSDFSVIIYSLGHIKEISTISNATIFVDLPTNQYFWRVRATYKIFYGNWSNKLTFNLMLNYHEPSLISGSVIPKIGNQLTEFNFTVIYFDEDNNSPIFVNITINSTSYMMDKLITSDIDFSDGCIYYYLIYLPFATYNYTYFFICSDGKYTDSTIIYKDLKRIETNNNKPRLEDPQVSPNSGNILTNFNFNVWYFDDDNNLPIFVNITLNKTIYSMIQVNPSDKNAIDGIQYNYITTLYFGYYEFQINCSDGLYLYATDWMAGPELNLLSRTAYAIVIGIEDYPGTNYDLLYCEEDAYAIYTFLIEVCNYKAENIKLLLNSQATRNAIYSAIANVQQKCGPDDIFFFYYSGHGGEDYPQTFYEFICPYNSIPDNPSYYIYNYELETRLDGINCAEKYIILDSCRSGGFIYSDNGEFYMTACSSSEDCLEDPQFQHGIFTYYFLNAYSAIEDINGDGVKSLEELFPYIASNTESRSYAYGYTHHPQKSDNIPDATVLYPSLGNPKITFSGNKLNYSFCLYGNGFINTLEINVYCGFTYVEIIDLLYQSPSNTGFGYYSGTIQLGINYEITSYEVVAIISGQEVITLRYNGMQGDEPPPDFTENGDSDDDDGDDGYDDISLGLIVVIVIAIGVLTIIGIVFFLRKTSSKKEILTKSISQRPITSHSAEISLLAKDLLNMKCCHKCGAFTKVGQKFCIRCGTSLTEQK